MVLTERHKIYAELKEAGMHLPALSDKSLTLVKLKAIKADQLATLPLSEVDLGIKLTSAASKLQILQAIKRCYDETPPFWFSEGRLPSKKYLLQVIYALDYEDAVLRAGKHSDKLLRAVAASKCKACHKRAEKLFEKRLEKRKEQQKCVLSTYRRPYGFENNATPLEIARSVLLSRHQLFALRNGWKERRLKPVFSDPAVQAEVQQLTERISHLADRLINLQ